MVRTSRPSRFAIACYWAQHERRFVCDLNEPECFAWGYWNERWDDKKSPSERWDRSRLERAHIIADSIGGSCEVQNFLLLCRQCHREAPMKNSRELMLAWARNREAHISKIFREFKFALPRAGVTEQDIEKLDALDYKTFASAFKKHLRRRQFDRHPHQFGLLGDCDAAAWICRDFITSYQSKMRKNA